MKTRSTLSRRALFTAFAAVWISTSVQAAQIRMHRHSGTVYPASIVAAALQDVWDLQTTAGLSGPQTKVAGVDALPAGVTITKDPNGAGAPAAPLNTLKFTGSVDMIDWDLTGFCIAINATVTVNFTNCKLTYQVDPAPYRSSYWVAIGQLAGTPTVTFTNCLLDFSSYANGNTFNHNTGSLSFSNCRLVNAAANYLNASRGTACAVDRCYFSSFGVNAVLGDHLEVIHWFQGTCTFTNSFINCSDGPPVPPIANTFTSLLYPAATAALSCAIDRCVLIGAAGLGGFYTMQLRVGSTGSMNYTLTNSVLEKGLTGSYLLRNFDPGHGTYTQTISNNYDYATGAVIVGGVNTSGTP